MGKTINDKKNSMTSWAKATLVLLLTFITSVFMQGGLFVPQKAAADVQVLNDWSNLHNTTTAPGTLAYTVPGGTNRMLVVAVSGNLTTATTQTMTLTYGGQSLTKQITNETTSARNHVWLFYLNDAKLKAATNSNLVFSITGGTVRFYQVNAAVFSDVDQSATPISSSKVWTNDATAATTFGPFATALTIGTNERAVEIAAVVRYASTTPRTITIASPWVLSFGPTTLASTDSINLYMNHDITVGSTTSSFTASNTTNGSMAAMSIKPFTSPTVGTVTVTPKYGTSTNASPTISAPVTSTASAVSGCQYTTNGTTWNTATLSGTQPNYTCSATPTGLSGSVTLNIQATNAGGTGAGNAVTLTADGTQPADGTLTLLTGNPSVGLLWTAATETGSGLNHYDVYFQTGATAPACGAGTLIYTGKWLNFSHSGRAASTQYSYRVCATDNVGNVSSGIFGTVTTTARPSTVNTCTACHGNPPVDNASRVGGTTGQFPGSHNTHSGSGTGQYTFGCTTCHANNTTMGHANANINISLTPGTYSRGTAPAVTNSFTPGNCSNTYCHSNGTGGTSQSGEARAVATNTSLNWGGTKTCYSCHGTSADVDGRPQYVTGSPKSNDHLKTTHKAQACTVCHDSILSGTSGSYVMDPTKHNSGTYSINPSMGYTYALGGGTCATSGCHVSAQWGVTTLGCVQCHAAVITRTKGRAAGTTLGNVVAEFGQTYGHKKTGRAAVSDDDCVVCHLEGDGTNHKPTTYHQDGNINLRDPLGAGETPITNMAGGAFTFQRFSTSYAAGSRSSALNNNDIAQVITLRFCIRCHTKSGATNPTARSNNGGTGTATMPFGGINLGANYTVANGASVAGGVVNVFTQFSSGNSSVHPIRAPRNKDFPTPARFNAPYNGFTRTGTAGAKTNGIILNCFDCHNNNTGTLLTTRTISAHGTKNTRQVRGTFYVSAPTLCAACHTGYTSDVQHLAGSAMITNGNGGEGMATYCANCHGSSGTNSATAPARPIPAADYHGNNALLAGGTWTGSSSTGGRPFAFIRNITNFTGHRPQRSTEWTTGSATCQGGTSQCAANNGTRTYTPGGQY